MGWPNNYVQGVYDSTGNLSGVENITGNINGLAAKLGFVAGADNTAAFLAYNNYLNTTARDNQIPLYLNAGIYYADNWVIAASTTSTVPSLPSPKIIGAGKFQTYIVPNTSSNPIFIEMARGLVHTLVFADLTIRGSTDTSGATPINAGQIGVALLANYDSSRASGGLTEGAEFDNIQVYGFGAEQFIIKGGSPNTGTGAFLQPMQYIIFKGNNKFSRTTKNHRPAFSLIGQVGQVVNYGNLNVSGGGRLTAGGANIYIGGDYCFPGSTASSVAANEITVTSIQNYTLATPIRAVSNSAGALPGELSKGTTYYIIDSADNKYKLATSADNALSNTAMPISTIGTPSWFISSLWATSVDTSTNTITFNIPPLLVDGDGIKGIGNANLPAGITHGTTYYYRPVTNISGQLYDTIVHAQAGGATGQVDITTTGTYNDFVFVGAGGGGGATNTPSGVDLGMCSTTNSDIGLLVNSSQGNSAGTISLKPYFEQTQIAIFGNGTSKINVNNGNLFNAAWGSGGVRANGAVFKSKNLNYINLNGIPQIFGTTDKMREITADANNPSQINMNYLEKYYQIVTFAGSMPAFNVESGLEVSVSAITANITAWANPTNMMIGDILTIHLLKDGSASAFTIVNPTTFKGTAIPTTPVTASVKYQGKWQWDGTNWMQISATGWV